MQHSMQQDGGTGDEKKELEPIFTDKVGRK